MKPPNNKERMGYDTAYLNVMRIEIIRQKASS
jgi:hypothetical protein